MEVCYLINQLAPGGAPTLLLDLVRRTDDPAVSYTVCFIEGDDSLVEDLREAGAEVVDFGASFKFDPRALVRTVCFFRRHEFDVLHAHLPYSQTLGRISALLGTVDAVVSTQHNVPENYHPITRVLERATRPLDDATVAVSTGVERAFRGAAHRYDGTLDDGWCTIYNGVDVGEFEVAVEAADPGSLDIAVDDDALVYLNVSRYVPAKDQGTLVDAMATVVDREPAARLFIVGWGPKGHSLRERVRQRGLDDAVTVTGRVPSVHPYYALADVFVSSSVFEGLPIAHLEAMAAGLPVVATDIPGVDEVVVDGETGRLVPPESPDALASAMCELTDVNRRTDFSRASRQRVSEEFDIASTVEAHRRLYESLSTGGGDG
ncbi:glycosyltransferase [Halosimplex rubrum]|uniref:Glycosyltransferase n=1 Tax=Halosimplex rubrum TaxID=869889 RepID=A0A7D5P9A1_9EURY|nr:glycosyltransferase [Halosimplex rubrum]QLH76839.1 glycosyltransferase [Halosimplex rubrum]